MDLFVAQPRLQTDTHVLPPLIFSLAQPTNTQDQQFTVPSRKGRLEENMIAEDQPATHQVGMMRQGFEDIEHFPPRDHGLQNFADGVVPLIFLQRFKTWFREFHIFFLLWRYGYTSWLSHSGGSLIRQLNP